MQLSLVIPVYNEIDNIRPLCADIRASLAGSIDYEVVFVDDASTDGTSQQLAELAADDPTIRVIRHNCNAGQSAAILTGVRAARAAWVATLDGDGQNDPADIVRLLETRDAGDPAPAMVAGWRTRREDKWIRRVSSRIANGVRSRLLHDAAPDTGCGLKLFSRDVFLQLPHFDHMHRFLPALFQAAGERVVTVPVGHRPRLSGQSKYGFFDRLGVGIVDLFGVAWLRQRQCRVSGKELLR